MHVQLNNFVLKYSDHQLEDDESILEPNKLYNIMQVGRTELLISSFLSIDVIIFH